MRRWRKSCAIVVSRSATSRFRISRAVPPGKQSLPSRSGSIFRPKNSEEFRIAEAALKEHWRTSPPPVMPGLQEVMAAVSGKNLVVTHRDRRSATALLQTCGVEVDDLVCPEDGFPRTPDPAR